MSCSSKSSASSTLSKPSNPTEVFEFQGKFYHSYNEMVTAKRERNRLVLDNILTEIPKKHSVSRSSGKTHKSKDSAKLPLRRNPPRSKSNASQRDNEDAHISDQLRSQASLTPNGKRCRVDDTAEDEKEKRAKKTIKTETHNSIKFSEPRHNDQSLRKFVFSKSFQYLHTWHALQNNSNKVIHEKELSAMLEYVLINGFAVKNREDVWRGFYKIKFDHNILIPDKPDSDIQIKIIKHEHRKPYEASKIQSEINIDSHHDLVPVKFLLQPNDYCAANVNNPFISYHDCQQTRVPKNDPVIYNNYVRQRNDFFIHNGVDRDWDREFGDGFDPALFIEQYCALHSESEEEIDNDIRVTTDSSTSSEVGTNYSCSLVQRCWERAVHAASTTVSVPLTKDDCPGLQIDSRNDPLDPEKQVIIDESLLNFQGNLVKGESRQSMFSRSKRFVGSILHHEVINVLDSVIDILLSAESTLTEDMAEKIGSKQVFDCWDVLNCLQDAIQLSHSRNTLEKPNNSVKENDDVATLSHDLSFSGVRDIVDRIFHSATDKTSITAADLYLAVANHFGISHIQNFIKEFIRARLEELSHNLDQLSEEKKGQQTTAYSENMTAPRNIPGYIDSYKTTIQTNPSRCPVLLNHTCLKSISMRLMERYGPVS